MLKELVTQETNLSAHLIDELIGMYVPCVDESGESKYQQLHGTYKAWQPFQLNTDEMDTIIDVNGELLLVNSVDFIVGENSFSLA